MQAQLRRLAVFGLVGASAMVMDPLGLQSFLLLRLLLVGCSLLLAGVLLWKLGVALPSSWTARAGALGLLGALGISAVLCRAPLVAFLGASGRQLGVAAWVLFAVAFVAGASLYAPTEGARVLRLLTASYAVAVLWIAVVAGFEVAGRPLVAASQSFPGRVQGTFGNPAVLGAFLSLALPILVAGAAARMVTWLAVLGVAAGIWLLVASGTRGAWLGIGVALVFAALSSARLRSGRGRWVMGGAAGLALVALFVATALTGRWGTAGAGIEGRLATWEVGVQVVAADPWLGVGPEGFATAFAETVDDEFVITYTRDQVNDRAHNGLLDLAITGGLIGLACYLMVLGAVILLLMRSAPAGSHTALWQGGGAAVVAYLTQQQAFFQLPAIDASFWFLVGILAAHARATRPIRRYRPAAAMVIVVAALAVVNGTIGVIADHAARRALGAEDLGEALGDIQAAARLRPAESIYPLLAAAFLRDQTAPDQLDRGLRLLDGALHWAPDDGVLVVSKAGLLVSRYEATGDTAALGEAEVMLRGLIARDHTNGEALLRLGAIRYYLGDFAQARAFWLEAARLMPNRQEPLDDLAALP
jgi:O-antigen ligase